MNAASPPVQLKITPVSHNSLLPRLTAYRLKKHGSPVVFIIIIIIMPPTRLKTLHFSSYFLDFSERKNFDFLISRTFLLSIFVLLPSCWGILLDSSRTGILDTLHSRRVLCLGRRAVWKVPLSPCFRESPFLKAASLARGDRLFYSVGKTSFNILDASSSDWFLKFIHMLKTSLCVYSCWKKSVYIHVCETLLFMFFLNEKEYVLYSKGKK